MSHAIDHNHFINKIRYEVAVPVLWKIPERIPSTKKAEKAYRPPSFKTFRKYD
ncbi:hypothetical protein RhiirA5_428768 [Rhizophagus irregularis]|uniref:Uncharacterized protein n=1 Tax=Rhizophagus irregularis TaxID=588596 RepID=A0A2N0NZT1_9GLOM|nr:hypothetical protein RhiirA5_428768 [Rhizophagus irregularis]